MCRVWLTTFLLWQVIWHRQMIWSIFTIGLIAALTDGVDGYIARKNNIVSQFGKAADRLADKYLQFVMYAFIILDARIAYELKYIAWLLVVIELGLCVTWVVALVHNKDVSAGKWGKFKMIAACIGVLACPAIVIVEHHLGVKISFCATPTVFFVLLAAAMFGIMSFWRHSQGLVG